LWTAPPRNAPTENAILPCLSRRQWAIGLFHQGRRLYESVLENILAVGLSAIPCRFSRLSLMANHWHFVAPRIEDGGMSDFLALGSTLDAYDGVSWQSPHSGEDMFTRPISKVFPVQDDDHFHVLLPVRRRRNAQRAELVARARGLAHGSLVPVGFQPSEPFATAIVPWPFAAFGQRIRLSTKRFGRQGNSMRFCWSIPRGIRFWSSELGASIRPSLDLESDVTTHAATEKRSPSTDQTKQGVLTTLFSDPFSSVISKYKQEQ